MDDGLLMVVMEQEQIQADREREFAMLADMARFDEDQAEAERRRFFPISRKERRFRPDAFLEISENPPF